MSPLPERRKSAEEIARLREEMGIPSNGQHPFAPAPPIPSPPPAPSQEDFAIPAGDDAKPNNGWVPRKPQMAPIPSTDERIDLSVYAPPSEKEEVPASISPFVKETFVRPEENEVAPETHVASSHLPVRRHTRDELVRLSYQNFIPASVPMSHLQKQAAHWFLLTFGYLLAFAGGAGGLLIAAFIAWKKPRSRHHAGIMLVIAVLVLVFGTLYYLKKFHAA